MISPPGLVIGARIPHIADAISRELSTGRGKAEVSRVWYSEEVEELQLEVGEIGVEGADVSVVVAEGMTQSEGEETEDLLCGWSFGGSLLGIQRELVDAGGLHCST